MAEVIDFKEKSQKLQEEELLRLNQLKVDSLRKYFQCMRCAFRCARCGTTITEEDYTSTEPYNAPYPFCKVCYNEYAEYQKRIKNTEVDKRYYWYNDEWVNMWRCWLEYQKSLESYRESPEFIKLLDEVEKILK